MSTEEIVGDPRISVFGSDEQKDVDIDVSRYVKLARLVLAREHVMGTCEMSLIFCDEEVISRLNKEYMDEDGPTDVLSFPVDEDLVGSGRNPDIGGRGPGVPSEDNDVPSLIGDVFIYAKKALDQSREHGVSFDEEIALLVVHGTLHLLNYDHYDEEEREEMQLRERVILEEFFKANKK